MLIKFFRPNSHKNFLLLTTNVFPLKFCQSKCFFFGYWQLRFWQPCFFDQILPIKSFSINFFRWFRKKIRSDFVNQNFYNHILTVKIFPAKFCQSSISWLNTADQQFSDWIPIIEIFSLRLFKSDDENIFYPCWRPQLCTWRFTKVRSYWKCRIFIRTIHQDRQMQMINIIDVSTVHYLPDKKWDNYNELFHKINRENFREIVKNP